MLMFNAEQLNFADAGEMQSLCWAVHIQELEGFVLLRKKHGLPFAHKDSVSLSFLRE